MRRRTSSPKPRGRLAPPDQRGATAIVIGLLAVPLFAVGALVIDVGALYQERRELQNGADAAALALAQRCAGGACGSLLATADQFGDANANDGAAHVDEVCGDGPGLRACATGPAAPAGAAGWVRVTTSTDDAASGTNEITYGLARALTDTTGQTLQAQTTAAWGVPGGERSVPPVIVSTCEVDAATDPDGDGVRSFAPGPPFAGTPTTLIFHGSKPGSCPAGPSGGDLPGGFGWLDSVNCRATVSPDDWVTVDPGNNGLPNGCNASVWRNQTILLPVYDQKVGSGNNGSYHVAGYAAFHVVGYKVGNQTWPSGTRCAGQPGNSGRCLIGHFTSQVVPTDAFDGDDFGVVGVKLTG